MGNDFGSRLRQLMQSRETSFRRLAAESFYSPSHLHDLCTGRRRPTDRAARHLDVLLGAGGELVALTSGRACVIDDERAAAELAERVAANDVSMATLAALESTFDDLATRYVATDPAELLPAARNSLAQVRQLIDARATLERRRQLLVVGGWLSMLAATLQIDLRHDTASEAWLSGADEMAKHAGHDEIRAWCLETRAWRALTAGHHRSALALSRNAQTLAPTGSSAMAQATAQEGRALARLGRTADTRRTLDHLDTIVASMSPPERPEHHYQYDPAKSRWYVATTLAWSGDPAGEDHAREILGWLEGGADGIARPRRIAGARLDLALALSREEPGEAAAEAAAAVETGWVVPSNWWRATEVLVKVEAAGVPEATDFREAYQAHMPARPRLQPDRMRTAANTP